MLPSQLHDEIQDKLDQGDEFLNADDFARAAELYREAVELIPEPKHLHDISLLAFTALGEAYYHAGRYQEALAAFRGALKAPGGIVNPLLHLRFGQTCFDSGDLNLAADSLTRAYALDGRTSFEDEDDKYLSFLGTRIAL